jgi:hypothetical protein
MNPPRGSYCTNIEFTGADDLLREARDHAAYIAKWAADRYRIGEGHEYSALSDIESRAHRVKDLTTLLEQRLRSPATVWRDIAARGLLRIVGALRS